MNNDTISVITIDSLLQLVAKVTPSDDGYILNRPLRVFRNVSPVDSGAIESYALVTWIPFTTTEDFFVKEEKVINIAEMAASFSSDYYRIADGVYSEKGKMFSWDELGEEEDTMSIDEYLSYEEAKRNNKIN